jgi:hypothetical protein
LGPDLDLLALGFEIRKRFDIERETTQREPIRDVLRVLSQQIGVKHWRCEKVEPGDGDQPITLERRASRASCDCCARA